MKDSYKDLTVEELLSKREELKKKYLELRFKMVMGHVENSLEKRNLRRKLSRLNTLIHEYALGIKKA